MKLVYNLLILSIIFFLCECAPVSSWEKKINKPYYKMVKIAEGLHVDIHEITVDEWLSYYEWIREKKDNKEASKVLPDSNYVSANTYGYIKGKLEHFKILEDTLSDDFIVRLPNFCSKIQMKDSFYFQLHGEEGTKKMFCPYGRQPITGLNYEQVIEYCKWKTKLKGQGKLEYRLPTKEEWKKFAVKGLSNVEKSRSTKDSICDQDIKCASYNYKHFYKWKGVSKYSIVGVKMFSPNKLGIYDLFGNVSEMTAIKGEAKGGNFSLYASQCHPDSTQTYSKAARWLGFRCVAEEK